MTSIDQFVLMDFETKDSIYFDIPGAGITLKNPESGSRELRGSVRYSAPHMLRNIENPNMREQLPCGVHYDLLRCSWPCWLPNYSYPISTLLIAGALYIDQYFMPPWNLLEKQSLSDFIVWHWDYGSRKHANFLELSFEKYCEDSYFPKTSEDITEVHIGEYKWQYALTGFNENSDESVNFYLAISNSLILTLTFCVQVVDSRFNSLEKLNNLKHKIVTDYLKHVIIEPRPMTETVPA